MLAWYSPTLAKQLRLDVGCLRQRAQEPVSHDHLFHTTLGVMGVQTQAHRPDLDWQTPCMAR
jgi:lipid A ethanolaminephosphotransferase